MWIAVWIPVTRNDVVIKHLVIILGNTKNEKSFSMRCRPGVEWYRVSGHASLDSRRRFSICLAGDFMNRKRYVERYKSLEI